MISYDGYIRMYGLPTPLPAKDQDCSKDNILCKWRPPLLECSDNCTEKIGICAKLNTDEKAFTIDALDSLNKIRCKYPSNSIVPKDYTDFTKGWKLA